MKKHPLLKYLKDELGVVKLAQTYWNDGSGRGMANISKKAAKDLGIKFVYDEEYERGGSDYRSNAAKIRAANPEAIAIWGWGADMGHMVKNIREAGIKAPILSISCDPTTIEIAGENVEGLLFGGDLWFPEINTPFNKQFVETYSKRWKTEPHKIDVFAAYYYELVYVLRDCIRHVLSKGEDPFIGENLEKAIGEIKFFDTLLSEGKMELLPNGMCVKPLYILKAGKGGEKVLVKMVDKPEPWK